MQEEVVAGKHPQREGSSRLLTPTIKVITIQQVILQATKSRDGTVKWRSVRVSVGFGNCAIRL